MSLRKRVLAAVADGEEDAKDRGSFFAEWWEYFSFTCNPFEEEPVDPTDQEQLFVDREEPLEQLGRLIGEAKYAQNHYKVLIVGPKGIGKRSVARFLINAVRNADFVDFAYDIQHNNYYPQNEEWDSVSLPEQDNLRFVVFENMHDIQRDRTYFNYYNKNRILTIGLVEPEYPIEKIEYHLQINLKPLSEDSIKEILLRRIRRCGGVDESLQNATLAEIAKRSMGIPQLAIELAVHSFKSCYRRKGDRPNVDDVMTVADRRGFSLPSDLDVTRKELNALKELVHVGKVTPIEFAERLSISRVMAWKYLERFHKLELVRKDSVGKSSQYEMTLPARALVQLMLYDWRDS